MFQERSGGKKTTICSLECSTMTASWMNYYS